MIKRLVPLALLAAWIPQAHAFPPCPLQPMEYEPPPGDAPVSATASSARDAAPWFKANYAFVGDPSIIDQITQHPLNNVTPDPERAKCRGGLPVLNSHTSTGFLLLDPHYAPVSGFAMVDLPYLPEVAIDGLSIEYRLHFTVDNNQLQDPDDWLDVVQMDFFRNNSAGMKYSEAISSIYRVRKTQRNRSYAAIEIIESRAPTPGANGKPVRKDRLVAAFPLQSDQTHTVINLRWSQSAKRNDDDSILREQYNIDTVFEVLGPSDEVLYTTQLPGQWASMLSMGLLDYNIADIAAYEKGEVMELNDMTIGAKRHH